MEKEKQNGDKLHERWQDPRALLLALRWLAIWIGRTPRNMDVNRWLPFSHVEYYTEFNGIRRAQELAGLAPNRRGGSAEAQTLSEDFKERWGHLKYYQDVWEALDSEPLDDHTPPVGSNEQGGAPPQG